MSWTVQPEDIAEGFPLNVHQNRIRARGFKDRENKDYFNINNIFEGLYLKSIRGKYFPAGYFMAIFITSNTLAKKIKWTVSQYTSTQLSHPKRSSNRKLTFKHIFCSCDTVLSLLYLMVVFFPKYSFRGLILELIHLFHSLHYKGDLLFFD